MACILVAYRSYPMKDTFISDLSRQACFDCCSAFSYTQIYRRRRESEFAGSRGQSVDVAVEHESRAQSQRRRKSLRVGDSAKHRRPRRHATWLATAIRRCRGSCLPAGDWGVPSTNTNGRDAVCSTCSSTSASRTSVTTATGRTASPAVT